MKQGLDQKEIQFFHQLLAEEMSIEECSRNLQCNVEVLKKLTPEAFEAAKVTVSAAAKVDAEEEAEHAAKILAAAAAKAASKVKK